MTNKEHELTQLKSSAKTLSMYVQHRRSCKFYVVSSECTCGLNDAVSAHDNAQKRTDNTNHARYD